MLLTLKYKGNSIRKAGLICFVAPSLVLDRVDDLGQLKNLSWLYHIKICALDISFYNVIMKLSKRQYELHISRCNNGYHRKRIKLHI
ncbi:hypothetical protein SAMN04487897_103344 [Paenibacillus sp. yr247]|nr:hypothetical protein SAMN04487897_103344 [Paenibacillus sp. yr247]